MKAIMVMFDSLNRHFLPPYGCDWVHAPNFKRLAEHSVCFDRAYAGSLPCMPARRELHTGRYNFLHRGWSPLEPFDDSMPELLKNAGIHTHLVSDHAHYWEDGGATYHTRYSTWECVRGQEGDPWKGNLSPDIVPYTYLPIKSPEIFAFKKKLLVQDAINCMYMHDSEDSCQYRTFNNGLEFIETNYEYDNWFLQIECFDPHEPFFTYEEYLDLYDIPDIGKQWEWPPYDRVNETPEEVEHVRKKYAALVSMCDANLGRVLDMMDKYELWNDTMLIVNTDHGYMLGEHEWWSKNVMPCYNEIANIPLFIWDPRCGKMDQHRDSLVQTIDIAPTLLEYFGQSIPVDMQGKVLRDTVNRDKSIRDYALFGHFGKQINITDGRYVYMHNAQNSDVQLYEYTLMPNRINCRMGTELKNATLVEGFDFTKNMPALKIPARASDFVTSQYGSQLFDLENDPQQLQAIQNEQVKAQLCSAIKTLLHENDAPQELYMRMGL